MVAARNVGANGPPLRLVCRAGFLRDGPETVALVMAFCSLRRPHRRLRLPYSFPTHPSQAPVRGLGIAAAAAPGLLVACPMPLNLFLGLRSVFSFAWRYLARSCLPCTLVRSPTYLPTYLSTNHPWRGRQPESGGFRVTGRTKWCRVAIEIGGT